MMITHIKIIHWLFTLYKRILLVFSLSRHTFGAIQYSCVAREEWCEGIKILKA